MYYFKYKDDVIEKYIVSFDINKVKKIRNNIINNCKVVIHKESDGIKEPTSNEYIKIRNLTKMEIGKDIYHFSYDEVIYPLLVNTINMLLREDTVAIDNIYLEKEYNNINELLDDNKRELLKLYYQKLKSILSFNLIATINIDYNITKNIGVSRKNKEKVYYVRNRKKQK